MPPAGASVVGHCISTLPTRLPENNKVPSSSTYNAHRPSLFTEDAPSPTSTTPCPNAYSAAVFRCDCANGSLTPCDA
ncbi:hypothetical protein D9M71_764000 [compost metagenome]